MTFEGRPSNKLNRNLRLIGLFFIGLGSFLLGRGIRRPTAHAPVQPLGRPRQASAPGVGLAYDVAAQKLADQFAKIDRINTQLAVVLAGLIAVAGLIFTATESYAGRVITGLLLLVALEETARASRVADWEDAPKADAFASYAGDEPDFMKEVALPEVLAALVFNRPLINRKADRLNRAIVLLAGVVVVIFFDRFTADAIRLAGEVNGLIHSLVDSLCSCHW